MIVFLVVSVIVLVGVAVAVTLGRTGKTDLQMYPPTYTAGGVPPRGDGPLTVRDLEDVRFDVAVRGYRMEQVDDLVDRMRATIVRLEQEASSPSASVTQYGDESAGGGRTFTTGPAAPHEWTDGAQIAGLIRFPGSDRADDHQGEKE